MTKIKAYIFDMDGTIVDNMPVHNQVWSQLLTEMGIDMPLEEFHHRTTGKKNDDIIRWLKGPGVSEEEIHDIAEKKEARYRELYRDQIVPVAGLIRLLEEAAAKGIPVALATSANPRNMRFIVDGLGVEQYFTTILTSADIVHGKPHPEIFLKAASRMGVAPEDCVVFEDAILGLEAAHRAGMPSIAVCTTLDPTQAATLPGVVRAIYTFEEFQVQSIG